METLFLCPVCGDTLTRTAQALRCPAGHSFDVAAAGYVHLLPSGRMHTRTPGDDRAMAAARSRFLNGGWYGPLADRLAELCLALATRDPVVIDSGCGEGYYTAHLAAALRQAGQIPRIAGIDISKECIRRAAKRSGDIEYAVASAFALPFRDSAADVLLNCFAPLALSEFRRVLRPGGLLLCVVPGPRHLWELKEILYDAPYENQEDFVACEGFRLLDAVRVETAMALPSREALSDLFAMTPYFWKTPRAGRARLEQLDALTVTAQFGVHVYRREDDTL